MPESLADILALIDRLQLELRHARKRFRAHADRVDPTDQQLYDDYRAIGMTKTAKRHRIGWNRLEDAVHRIIDKKMRRDGVKIPPPAPTKPLTTKDVIRAIRKMDNQE